MIPIVEKIARLGVVGHEDPKQDAGRGGLDVEGHLLGLDLDDRLALGDGVTLGLEPCLTIPVSRSCPACGMMTLTAMVGLLRCQSGPTARR